MKKSIFWSLTLLLSVFLTTSCASTGSSSDNSKDTTTSEVTSKRNISRVRIVKSGTGSNLVEIKFRAGRGSLGTSSSSAQNIRLQGSSGSQEVSSFRGFRNVTFPFEGLVRFDYQKQANDTIGDDQSSQSIATTTSASVGIKIDEPGRWVVTIYY